MSFTKLRSSKIGTVATTTISALAILTIANESHAKRCEAPVELQAKVCDDCTTEPTAALGEDNKLKSLANVIQKTTSEDVSVFHTDVSSDKIDGLQPKPPLKFGSTNPNSAEGALFDLDPDQQFQFMEGFGGNLTESCAMNLLKLSEKDRKDVLEKMFSKKNGAGFDVIRMPVGSSDFADASKGNYTYNDTPGNKPDPKFKHFDMSRDEKSFALIREARKINPKLKVLISPWSPPAWMKDKKQLKGGKLDPKHYQDFANYFVKVIREYKKQGVPVEMLTMQNEPGYPSPDYPSMSVSAEEQATLIRDYLGPTLKREGLPVRILSHDHNWDMANDVNKTLDDAKAKKYTGGVAYHCYGGNRWQMADSMKKHPDVPHFQTECTGSLFSNQAGDFKWWMDTQSVGSVGMGTTGALGWNLCLDEKGGPQNGGCDNCRGLVTLDFSTPKLEATYNAEYHALGQVSRFIKPGSRRIGVFQEGAKDVQATAFLNDDGKTTFVATNPTDETKKFRVRRPDCKEISYEIPAGGAVTFTWASKNRLKK